MNARRYEKLKRSESVNKCDCDGTLRLWNEPAITKFVGLQNIGVIHDEIEDGAEIVWELVKCRQAEARQMVVNKSGLAKRLRRELGK